MEGSAPRETFLRSSKLPPRNRVHYLPQLSEATRLQSTPPSEWLKERMLPHAREAADLGLSFVISAGWMPGISELAAVYANALARSKMDTIESSALTLPFMRTRITTITPSPAWAS